MKYLLFFFGWILFVVASINTIAFGLRYTLDALPVNSNNIIGLLLISLMYTIWFKIIKKDIS
jgi:hypothetical protein